MFEFARDASTPTTLHIPKLVRNYELGLTSIAGGLCGARAFSTVKVGRDDLLCGRCLDLYEAAQLDTPGAKAQTYDEYLKSDHWQHMREIAREHYGNTCCLCGSDYQLDVHHRTYERRGRERLSDVILLCRDCHSRYHAKAS